MTVNVIVIGAGPSGLLAAVSISPFVDSVTVVERDELAGTAGSRSGIPQARHPHLLMPGGAAILEHLLPGITDRLVAAGAHRITLNSDLIAFAGGGWLSRDPTSRVGLSCSRALLDRTILDLVREMRNVSIVAGVESTRLLGDRTVVCGVEVRSRVSGVIDQMSATMVIDGSGRGSKTRTWLEGIGTTPASVETVDSGHSYATRLFKAPAGAEAGFPAVMIMPDITTGNPGRNAVLMPIEGGRWLVTLGATRGSASPADDNEFMEFARHGVPHGLVGDLIADAEPLSDIWRSRSTANRRYGFGNSSDLPPGLIVVGDAVAAFNPVYGHGLSFAARCALALRNAVQKYGPDPMRSPYIQSKIAETSQMPWQIATSQDSRYRETIGQPPTRSADIRHIFAHRIVQAAAERPSVAAAWIDIISLSRPTVTMANPALLMGALLGRRRPPRPDPPLTRVERQLLPAQR